MGCGDARLAKSVNQTVYSFDLVSISDDVIATDIAHVPLSNESVDIVVFCLSLMGTNIGDFILEASRILKPNGILKIVEVRSRFEKDANGIKQFLKVVKRAGFNIQHSPHDNPTSATSSSTSSNTSDVQFNNTMFFMLECTKMAVTGGAGGSVRVRPEEVAYTAKPCLYKKR